MTFLRDARPKLQGVSCSLLELAGVLKTTPEVLLGAACRGQLDVFVHLPDGVGLYSVHEDAVDIDSESLRTCRIIEKMSRQEDTSLDTEQFGREADADDPDPWESEPQSMALIDIYGLILDRADCYQILQRKIHRKYLFSKGVKELPGIGFEDVNPMPRRPFLENRSLRSTGWRLACYPRYQEIIFTPGIGYLHPKGVDISIDGVFATVPAIERFLDTIDEDHFLSDILVGGEVLVDNLPDYFSKKLKYLIKANRNFWKDIGPGKEGDFPMQIEAAKSHLLELDFQILCTKERASSGLIEASLKFITPVYARDEAPRKEGQTTLEYLTPELKALMAASKWMWGSDGVELGLVRTHPLAEDVYQTLLRLGIKDNDRKYGGTLIRPENAAGGRPTRKLSSAQEALKGARAVLKRPEKR